MFLPIKADFALPRFPVLTILVCAICFGVFLKQQSDWTAFEYAIAGYCDGDRSRLNEMVMQRVEELTEARICGEVMYNIDTSMSPDSEIDAIVDSIKPLAGLSITDSRDYTRRLLKEELDLYRRLVPDDPDTKVAYHTRSWNPLHMITASFAHADWGHIIFNLIFFVAFATTVEALAGPVAFAVFILVNSLIIGVVDSTVSTLIDNHHWTLGLSGIVMGMMGMFAYLIPRGKIRCYYWVIVLFGSVAIPGWVLALWYIGGDIYQLFTYDNHGGVNVLAHVAGGVAGYFYGMLFLKNARETALRLQRNIDHTVFRLGF